MSSVRDRLEAVLSRLAARAADAHHLPLLARMPLDPTLAQLTDAGRIEDVRSQWLVPVIDAVLQ